jgi:outer membrane protein OmpA-like peptidoglycan-associated protein
MVLLPGGDARVIFTECYRDDGVGDCDLVEGIVSGDGSSFTHAAMLEGAVNDIEWDHHPAFHGDGGTGSILVFASERFGGQGGSDLWMSRRGERGWSSAYNLGEKINTAGNEISPWLSPDGKELYFSSDALPGRGGFDIYVVRLEDGTALRDNRWSLPEPLGMPFNSDEDDLFFNGSLSADTVYFASNRDGGEGGYDVYRCAKRAIAPPPPPPPPAKEKQLVLRVRAKNAFTLERIQANISVTPHNEDLALAEGTGTVELPLQIGRTYSITAAHAGFENAVESFRTGGKEDIERSARDEGTRMVVEHDIVLLPVAEKVRKIYAFTVEFDFNLSNIRPEEEKKLDSVAVLLGKYPQSTVVISGHTDSVGTVVYNIKLGYSRAKQVSTYVSSWLRGHNVHLVNDVEIRTYGEAEPIAPNSTDEGRQRNRRVEIAIVRNE